MVNETQSTLSLTINGQPVELFMSYGMLTSLAKSIPSLDVIPAIIADNDSRDAFLDVLLSKRDKNGVVLEARKASECEISIEDVEKALVWAQDHLMDFFLRGLQRAQALSERIRKAQEA